MPLPTSLHLLATTLSATAFAAVGPASFLDAPEALSIVSATGSASPASAEVGECVGFALDVTGTDDGVAIEPITAALTGPYDGWPSVGSIADGPTIGAFSATWTGSEWSYDGDCITVDVAGGYAWTLDNPNNPEGLDLIIHDASIVDITEPVLDPGDGNDDGIADDTATEDDQTTVDVSGDRGGSGAGTKQPQLAVTGANESMLVAGAAGGLAALASGVGLALRARRRRARLEEAA